MTPLHIQIALHYHCSSEPFEMILTNAVRRSFADDLVNAGMLIEIFGEDGHLAEFERSEGLAVFVEALCSMPFPVQRWVMPAPPAATTEEGRPA